MRRETKSWDCEAGEEEAVGIFYQFLLKFPS